MARASDLSPEYVLLGLLAEGPSYGYELHQRLVTEFEGIWNLSQSQCYNILHRLEENGVLQGEIVHQDHPPHRKLLRLTPTGQHRMQDWLTTPTPSSTRAIRIDFLTRLYFSRNQDQKIASTMIADQIHSIEYDLEKLKQTLEDIPARKILNRLSLQLRIQQLQTCVAWLDECHTGFESSEKIHGGMAT